MDNHQFPRHHQGNPSSWRIFCFSMKRSGRSSSTKMRLRLEFVSMERFIWSLMKYRLSINPQNVFETHLKRRRGFTGSRLSISVITSCRRLAICELCDFTFKADYGLLYTVIRKKNSRIHQLI